MRSFGGLGPAALRYAATAWMIISSRGEFARLGSMGTALCDGGDYYITDQW